MNENIPVNNENSTGLAEAEYSKMNFIKRVFGVMFFPGKVMQSLEKKPRVLFGLLLAALSPVALILLTFPMYMEYMRAKLEITYANMDIDVTAQQMDSIMSMSKYSSLIGGAIGAVALMLIEALVLWGLVKIFKGEGRYKQVLSVLGYTGVIAAVSVIVMIISVQLTGSFSEVSFTSLASFLPDMKGSFFYGAAKMIEIFSIWQYIVLGIGLSSVSKLSKNKIIIIVAIIFAAVAIYGGVTEFQAAKYM
ncbi:Yip1-like protein [Ruminiclostridium sufflavum DSM 19573]|uniref:Yip1-like protein n=1 Tax=Ruminiclostridium sufflavum DSM 19573 TaxID=1121337 RepID=A0A318Y846_9FIRM|nr:Yip1 family protein [Ruminiclostridium sufflavum]PYG88424.1 Yip1-like protein [Ruminiclostridium sufflavum DSM 19573]